MPPSQQPQNADSTLWRRLWTLRVPNKVKNLLWWACRNAMPTKANLVRKTIINDPLCERCRAAHETPLHALWTCKELDIVRETHGSGPIRSQSNFQDFKPLLSTLLQQQSDVEMVAMIMWSVWTQRNQIRLNKPASTLHQIVQQS